MFKLSVTFSRGLLKLSSNLQCVKCCSTYAYLDPPEINIEYFLNEANFSEIEHNIKSRKSHVDVNNLFALIKKFKEQLTKRNSLDNSVQELQKQLFNEISKLPNRTHSKVLNYHDNEPKIIKSCGKEAQFGFEPKTFPDLVNNLGLIRTQHLGNLTGRRSYYLMGHLANLEAALIKFTIKKLLKHGFKLISVPDIILPEVIDGCGMETTGQRSQVYKTVSPWENEFCLAGTAEMPLAGFYSNRTFEKSMLPQRVCAASRCYRAETSAIHEENYGIFRVREFSKVEMFGVTTDDTGKESEEMLLEFLSIQEDLFSELGLCYQVLDMPASDLGQPAYQKYDIEAWMPGKKMYGEISSASNCTDYQSRRLHIKYEGQGSEIKHLHTVNGTACAVPRMMIALLESFQNENGSITIPDALRPYMNGETLIAVKPHLKMRRSKF